MQNLVLVAAMLLHYAKQPSEKPHDVHLKFNTQVVLCPCTVGTKSMTHTSTPESMLSFSSLLKREDELQPVNTYEESEVFIPEPPDFWSHVDDFDSYDYMSTLLGRDDWFYHWQSFSFQSKYTREIILGPSLWSTYPITLNGPAREYKSLLLCLRMQLK